MSRVILLVLAVLVFFWLLRRALGSRKSGESSADEPSARRGGPAATPDLVPCAHCGVLVPKDEALADPRNAENADRPGAGRFYCSEDHRRLGPG